MNENGCHLYLIPQAPTLFYGLKNIIHNVIHLTKGIQGLISGLEIRCQLPAEESSIVTFTKRAFTNEG
ncbi:hypothetical protein ILYODFUR_008791 [Ilyodon furcidens]|uniref:Uncharacterized protein n=1 Tax=Ilyodon furcidens TaxID=33524 RepID=A0ABV0VF33_9TELE